MIFCKVFIDQLAQLSKLVFYVQNALNGLEKIQKEIQYGNGTQHREVSHGSEVQLRDRSTNLAQKRPLSRDRLVSFSEMKNIGCWSMGSLWTTSDAELRTKSYRVS